MECTVQRKNVLLVFSKVPEPGMVKTRLSILKDGWFKPEVASYLYHCMFFDAMETCCAALVDLEARHSSCTSDSRVGDDGQVIEDVYELVVSTTPKEKMPKMRQLFESSGEWPREIKFDFDEGASFDEHYNDAFEKAWESGADTILSIGADMPALTKADIIGGFDALHSLADSPNGGIVLSPDQEMGVSMVGWTKDANFDHTGVFYNQSGLTVLPAYIHKARDLGIPARYLPAIPDVDTMQDLMHNVTLVEALCYCAESGDDVAPPWRTEQALEELRLTDVRVRPNDLHDPRESIDK